MTSDPVRDAADWIRQGGVVVFPTETFYGLAVDPRLPDAVAAVLDLKGRPAGMALPLVAASIAQVEEFVGLLGDANARLAAAFWPGPLSLVFDAPAAIVPAVHAGTHTVAVRVPAHAIARALAETYGHPLTATSANRSGEPAPVEIAEIAEIAEVAGIAAIARDRRVVVLDGGRTPGGAPSTIVDARTTPVRIIRDGAVPSERVLRSIHE
jgi:L-threonylcarbamoyladenylate synthase